MRKTITLSIILLLSNYGFSQDFYAGIGGTFVTSAFDTADINKDLSDLGINPIDDVRYTNFGISAKIRAKVTDRIGVNAGYSYIFSTTKNVPMEATINIPLLGGNTKYNAEVPTKISASNYNVDFSYSLISNKLIDVFAMVGVDYSVGKLSIDFPAQVKTLVSDISKYENFDDSVLGYNFGAGAIIVQGVYAEVKSKVDFSQYQATLGYLYKF